MSSHLTCFAKISKLEAALADEKALTAELVRQRDALAPLAMKWRQWVEYNVGRGFSNEDAASANAALAKAGVK